MSTDELKYKEQVLRECFKDKLAHLNVEGTNDVHVVKCVKTYGALWHYVHQLLMAEDNEGLGSATEGSATEGTAETMEIRATGLKMTGGK